jgi:hypothetical protein
MIFEPTDAGLKYRGAQRYLESRLGAANRTLSHFTAVDGTLDAGRNAAKRSKRARLEPEFGRRWKKGGTPRVKIAVRA